jgi:DNA-binding NtrC family response regulator
MVGTFLGAFIAPLIRSELDKATNNNASDIETGETFVKIGQRVNSLHDIILLNDYEEPVSKYGLIFDEKNNNHPFIKKGIFKGMEVAITSNKSVLITGATGTGKGVLARAIHDYSSRSDCAFINLHCGTFPADLIENELFGHVKGSYTGAHSEEIGLVEAADGGTLFLDEIGTMPVNLQPKLLKVIEEKELMKVGGRTPIKVDVRIVAATNIDIEAAVKEEKFRKDLYYRLNVIKIDLPPLKERKSDLIPLMRYFLREELSKKRDRQSEPIYITTEAINALLSWEWRENNVRELRNFVERMLLYKLKEADTIRESDIPVEMKSLKIDKIYPNPGKILLYKPESEIAYENGADEEIYENLLKINPHNFRHFIKKKLKSRVLMEKVESILKTKKAINFYLDWTNMHYCEKCVKKIDRCRNNLKMNRKCIYNNEVVPIPTFMDWLRNANLSLYKKNGD